MGWAQPVALGALEPRGKEEPVTVVRSLSVRSLSGRRVRSVAQWIVGAIVEPGLAKLAEVNLIASGAEL